MKNGISEIVGQASCADGSRKTAYRALRPLVCASCGGLIAAQAIFTREGDAGRNLRLWPRCAACVPFTLETVTAARSVLLDSLLTPTKEPPPLLANRNEKERATDGERRKVAEAARQRLGPALERTRRERKN